MRAVWLREFGPPSVLVPGEADEPAGEVVIDVVHANITFVETQVRAGRGPFPVQLPMIPGNGVGGVVDGRRVIASLGGSGGYAERVAVPASALLDVPDGMALDAAVALLADGRTATMLFKAANVAAGERVLVEAAAGGVGTLLVQLARSAGATVVGAVGSEAKLALVDSLGAEAVLYDDVAGPLDVVFDGVGGEIARSAFTLLARGGRMLSYGLASGEWAGIGAEEAAARGVTLVQPNRSPDALRGYTEQALHSGLAPVIGQRFPLENASDAHAAIESRATTGKTLLDVR
ncbi:zinc-binding dehydrogenase [Solirubrobacter ginsenosidimutans]|uniref:Zinc-binding dehydrogenase n=1 Tax=Solirubrobacter ginsenosidimutans TaxID=490573 RepID=A0A9X3MVP0_9ACTN|nr:zinc-binding dehydrogenase [Solirubrobacter ginsenosidimutans]MDA0162095.1 zinc-binding dehydrogenase [Solirubrobacter ginsenosidimutans]